MSVICKDTQAQVDSFIRNALLPTDPHVNRQLATNVPQLGECETRGRVQPSDNISTSELGHKC